MNKVKVLFFATLRDKTGVGQSEIELPEMANVAGLKQALLAKFPQLPRNGSTLLVAVNKEYAFDEEVIPAGAEIALFPPVSGG
jgi:molybdopterin converting factor subunit 1